jgi:hypothetical protein
VLSAGALWLAAIAVGPRESLLRGALGSLRQREVV